MKLKNLFSSMLFAFIVFSCSDNNDDLELKSTGMIKEFNFKDSKEMEQKLQAIKSFRQKKDSEIMDKILKRNNLEMLSDEDFNKLPTFDIKNVDKKVVLEDIKFYQNELLKSIYEERKLFNFVSIKSIADEINCLSLVNPTKAKKMLNDHSALLTKNDFGIVELKRRSNISEILNVEGVVSIDDKKINPILNDNATSREFEYLRQGILCSNGFYSITYHAGCYSSQNWLGSTSFVDFTQFGSVVYGNLYTSVFNPNNGSRGLFGRGLTTTFVSFPGGSGEVVTNTKSMSTPSTHVFGNGSNPSGNFATPLNGQWVFLSGTTSY